jgi:hypothetical protein
MKIFLEKNYKTIAGLILGFMAVVSVLNANNDSAIFDETAHIPAGYSYVTQHEIRLNPEHPPLLKDLAGLPLLFLHLNFKTSGQAFWEGTLPGKWDEGQWAAGRYLLYQAGNNPDQIIFWSRIPIVILSLILGWFIFKWVREMAGTLAGLLALAIYATDPNILGHNHFVTTDIGIAAFMTFAFYYYLKFIKLPSWKNVLLAGIFTGLMMLTKFSFITMLPVFLLLTLIYPLVARKKAEGKNKISNKLKNLGGYVGKGAAVFGISLLVVWVFYAANTFNMTKETVSRSIDNNFLPSDTANIKNVYTNKTLHFLNNQGLTRPLTEFGIGIGYVFRRVSGGNGAYFMGQVSGKAFPAYFPTVFILKEPLPLLLLYAVTILIALIIFVRFVRTRLSDSLTYWSFSDFIRQNITSLALFTFISLYAYISITGNLNIGFRHLFPILPFAYILTAKVISDFIRKLNEHSRFIWSTIVGFIVLIMMGQTAVAYPAYMSYFNAVAGGPAKGYRYVTDSNADWGQDLKRLKSWVDHYNWCPNNQLDRFCRKNYREDLGAIDKIRINYFGGGDIKYYFGDLAIDWWDSKRPVEPGWYAVSTNFLQGSIYDKEKKDSESYRWIQSIPPVTQVGTSIFIYFITSDDIERTGANR